MQPFKVRLQVQPEGRFMIRHVAMEMTAQEFLAMTVSQSGWAIGPVVSSTTTLYQREQ